MSVKTAPEKGKTLLAEPFLKDGYFTRAVVLIAEHNSDGTVGFIMNKPTELKLNAALENFPEFDTFIYLGGPVQRDSIYYVHTYANLKEAIPITGNLFWGGDFDELKRLISEGEIAPENIRFMAGYAGWDPKQLNEELKEKAWMVTEAGAGALLSETSKMWAEILKTMGEEYALLINSPIDPSLN
jgi:putative transcriptional regulator